MDPPALPSQLPELLRDLSQPARRLRDAGCCGFCVLRLVGATEHASYQQPPAVVERLLDEHVGGRPGGTVRSEEAVRTQQIASSALAASGATSDRRIRAFVTTRDPSLFSGAKLVQIVATDPVALRKSLAEAIGHPNVPLGVKLNARSALTSVDAVRALGENPRLEVSRSVTPVQPGAANAHEAAADNGEPSVAKAGTAPAVETIGSPATQEDYLGSTFVCCACLGILQRAGADASEMIASVHRDGWECPTGQRVVLGIAIPSDVLVRQRLLVMVGFPMAPPVRRPIELKEAMLWLFEKVLQQELKCELVPAMVQETGDYGMSILLGWKAAAGVLSDARRVAVRYGAASYRAQPSRKRHRAEKGSDRNSSDVDTSWQTIAKLLTSVDTMRLRDVCEFPPRKPLKCISPMEMKIHRPSIYVAGRYMKFERGLSQTPWAYAEPGATSVQEVISNVLAPHFRPDKATFTSGGREDMDVRMLGTGRPFAFIMENPRVLAPSVSTQHIAAAQNDVNHQAVGRVEITSLKIVPKAEIDALKSVEETKRKTYRCICWVAGGRTVGVSAKDLADKLDAQHELKVAQRTPLRVAHRRTGIVREKVIHSMSSELISSRIFILDMVTSAGTYVKEFVHGDLGRTSPSVGSLLGVPVDILQLDVLGIDYAV